MNSPLLAMTNSQVYGIVTVCVLLLIAAGLYFYSKNKKKAPAARSRSNRPDKAQAGRKGSIELYVGNLVYEMTDDQLRAEFAKFGIVESARIVTDRRSGRSKGYGFVTMTHRSEAQIAISKLNNFDYKGRKMRVNESRPGSRRNGAN